MNSDKPVLTCEHLGKIYSQGPQEVEVLKDINLEILAGDQIAIVGSSGSGKTTLLNLLGGLDLPTTGSVHVADKNLDLVNETERGLLRNQYLGFVYQFHHLLGEFTALENVCMPLLWRYGQRCGRGPGQRRLVPSWPAGSTRTQALGTVRWREATSRHR